MKGYTERQIFEEMLKRMDDAYIKAIQDGMPKGREKFVKAHYGISLSTHRDITEYCKGNELTTGVTTKKRPLATERIKILAERVGLNIDIRFVEV